jgi:hypothetical protein
MRNWGQEDCLLASLFIAVILLLQAGANLPYGVMMADEAW